jgi:hypothetical protein
LLGKGTRDAIEEIVEPLTRVGGGELIHAGCGIVSTHPLTLVCQRG